MDELKGKYVPLSYYTRFLDKWHQFSQGDKSANEYVIKFDEFLNKGNVMITEDEAQILFRFRELTLDKT